MDLNLRDYENAIHSQTACNLSGIVHSLSDVTTKIWEEARKLNKGTEYVNTHPICRLYAEQIAHLSGSGMTANTETWEKAHVAVQAKIEELKGGVSSADNS